MNLKDVNVLKILKQKYAIVTKNFPLKFHDSCGNEMDNIEDAYLYSSNDDAITALGNYDEPEEFHIIKVNITYEF